MENQTFKQGDVVVLKSGSPKMTVANVKEDNIYYAFFDFKENKVIYPHESVPKEVFVLASDFPELVN